jgi:rubrerythrin
MVNPQPPTSTVRQVHTSLEDPFMKEMTKANLEAAFAGESQAHMKYLNFADRAEREGLVNVARLFRAASFSEQMHASAHLRALEGIQGTAANLAAGAGGENFEIGEMYAAYRAVAELQGEARALRSMTHAFEAEKVHARLYTTAGEQVAAGKDASGEELWVCGHCGFTMEGEPPDVCPVCGARRERFVKF